MIRLARNSVPVKNVSILLGRKWKQSIFPHKYFISTAEMRTMVATHIKHRDIGVPNFDDYRLDTNKDATGKGNDSDDRKTIPTVIAALGGVGAMYGTKEIVRELVSSMAASAEVLAMAKIEIKLVEIPEGRTNIYKWRGKPLFVRHRTPVEIERERNVSMSELRDPQTDQDRTINPDWLVIIGICTHLGCVPICDAGDYFGYYCPCHGSHYDGSGRIRKGPAPTNMDVPHYEFLDEDVLLVG